MVVHVCTVLCMCVYCVTRFRVALSARVYSCIALCALVCLSRVSHSCLAYKRVSVVLSGCTNLREVVNYSSFQFSVKITLSSSLRQVGSSSSIDDSPRCILVYVFR